MTTNNQELKPRLLTFSEDVEEGVVGRMISKIIEWNMIDDFNDKIMANYERPPIYMLINSYGGVVYDGFGLMSVMEHSLTPVVTVCSSKGMSMGFSLFIAGHTRLIYDLGTLMYHEISGWNVGKLTEQKISIVETERLQKEYDKFIVKHTKISQERLDEVKSNRVEWYLTAEEAIKYGIADEIINAPVQWIL